MDTPATITLPNGTREWHHPTLGVLHRTDGPAVIHANGQTEFWVMGKPPTDPNAVFFTPARYAQWFGPAPAPAPRGLAVHPDRMPSR